MRITVGIPSYNEENSIRILLEVLDAQVMDGENRIDEIIISDDSTDTTPELVNDFARKSRIAVSLLHHNRRRGVANAWNEIFRNARGDTIVLYDADVLPGKDTTHLLTSKLRDDIGICASNPLPLNQKGIAAKASSFNAFWLRRVRKQMLSQYTVMGRGLSIHADLAKMITVPDIIATDLYLQCIVMEFGYKIYYCDEAVVWFKPACRMLDFASQVVRAVNGHSHINDYIDKFNLKLPHSLIIKETIKEALQDPKGMIATAIAYVSLPIYLSRFPKDVRSSIWHIANSTKGNPS